MTDRTLSNIELTEYLALKQRLAAAEQLAEDLYVHSHFHEGEPNPTATLMREGAERIRRLAAAEECLRSRNCDDLCLVHIQRAEAAEKERDELRNTIEGANESEQWHQEILDLFARHGSGDYEPTHEEVEIVNDGVTHILRAVRAAAAKVWFKRFLSVLREKHTAETALQAAESILRELLLDSACYCQSSVEVEEHGPCAHCKAEKMLEVAAIRAIKT